jgi:diguanylate cyclase (GGDEF)-like protein
MIVFILCRYYTLEFRDKHKAQYKALDDVMLSKKAYEELLAIQDEHQEHLEVRVQDRTLELNIALQELENLNRELAEKNTLDALSGLYNRRYYDQKILAEFRRSKRNLTPLSLVLIDIDHFKTINDTYGHLAGDQCIVWIAEKIKQSLKRSTDMSFRYGGEEFCLILPNTDSEGAIILAENLKAAINMNPFLYQKVDIQLTASFGVTTYQQQKGILPEHIFAASDKALYSAKHNGRNQVQHQELTEP